MKKLIYCIIIIICVTLPITIMLRNNNNIKVTSSTPIIIYKTKIVYRDNPITLKEKSDLNKLIELDKQVELLGQSQKIDANMEYSISDIEHYGLHENYLSDIKYVKFLISNQNNYYKDLNQEGIN